MRFYGKYKGICRDNNDPKMQGRIRAEVPFPLGTGRDNWSAWALPCVMPGQFDVPEEGDGVWIEFEGGDPYKPIWTGIWYKGAGENTTAPFQSTHAPLTDMDGNEVDPDKLEHATDEVDDAEHREWHDHQSEFYTPHRRGWRSGSGHRLEWNDHPGRDGKVTLAERFGRLVEFTARGFTRLVGKVLKDGGSTPWTRLDEHNEAKHQLIFADDAALSQDAQFFTDNPNFAPKLHPTDGPQLTQDAYMLLKSMAQAYLLFLDTEGKEKVELADFFKQRLTINSVEGSEYVELLDKAGQSVRLDVATGTVQVQDQEGNYVLLENGKITVHAASGNVVLNVPDGSNVHVGGEDGEELATKTFVQQYFNTHTHVSGSPGSPTGPPMTPAPLTPGSDITKKQKSE